MNKASSKYLMIAGLTGAVAVAIGAFGAHGIKPHLDEYQLGIFKTGNQYHFYHALAMLLVAFLMSMNSTRYNKWAFYSFLIGVIFVFRISVFISYKNSFRNRRMEMVGSDDSNWRSIFYIGMAYDSLCRF